MITAWVAILLAAAGAILLNPIGNGFLNAVFAAVRVCMAADLGMPVALWHLFRGENPDRSRPRRKGPKHEDSDDPSPEDGN